MRKSENFDKDYQAYINKNLPITPKTKVKVYKKIGRNEKCPCASGKKFKHCCIKKTRK